MSGITLTPDMLKAAVVEYVGRLLPEDVVQTLAGDAIEQRIGTLTIEEAMPRLHCSSRRNALAFCRQHGIPVIRLGHKTAWVRVADIAATLKRAELTGPREVAGRGNGPDGLNGRRKEAA